MDQQAAVPREVKLEPITRCVGQSHGAATYVARTVHFLNEPAMQVAFVISHSYGSVDTYMTTDEARQLAAALVECADHFDAQVAGAGA